MQTVSAAAHAAMTSMLHWGQRWQTREVLFLTDEHAALKDKQTEFIAAPSSDICKAAACTKADALLSCFCAMVF